MKCHKVKVHQIRQCHPRYRAVFFCKGFLLLDKFSPSFLQNLSNSGNNISLDSPQMMTGYRYSRFSWEYLKGWRRILPLTFLHHLMSWRPKLLTVWFIGGWTEAFIAWTILLTIYFDYLSFFRCQQREVVWWTRYQVVY